MLTTGVRVRGRLDGTARLAPTSILVLKVTPIRHSRARGNPSDRRFGNIVC